MALRIVKITSVYPMFGDVDPKSWIEHRLSLAAAGGKILREGEDLFGFISVEDKDGIQNITFYFKLAVKAELDFTSIILETGKAVANEIVGDTDCEVVQVEWLS